jgi:hypothetical protein
MPADTDRDRQAFALRCAGRSFGAIATELGYDNAPAATVAFLTVLRAEPDDVRQSARHDEHVRLDTLEAHVRNDTTLDASAMQRRLAVVDRMRKDLDSE